MKELTFRKIEEQELQPALDLIWQTFIAFKVDDMPQEGIDRFRESILFDRILTKIVEEALVFTGCYHNNKIVGVIGVRHYDYLSLLFVDEEYHGHGNARTLFEIVKAHAISAGKRTMTVKSSPYAVEVYKAFGFKAIGEMIEECGIRHLPMALDL